LHALFAAGEALENIRPVLAFGRSGNLGIKGNDSVNIRRTGLADFDRNFVVIQ
jgi:hypothetical protein